MNLENHKTINSEERVLNLTAKQCQDYNSLMAATTLLSQRAEMIKYQTLALLNHQGLECLEELIAAVKEENQRLSELSDKFSNAAKSFDDDLDNDEN